MFKKMRRKNKQLKKLARTILVFTLIFSWVFSGWPNVLDFYFNGEHQKFPPKIQKAHAAVAYQGSSLVAATSTGVDVTPSLPTHQADDIFLLQVLVRDVDDTLTVTDWTQITTIDDGTAGRHWWYWKRATSSSETAPLVDKNTTSGDTYATVTSYRGAETSGDPWEATSAATCTGTADPFNLNEVTTLTDGSLVVASWNDRDNASNSATYSPTSPSSLTSNMFLKSATGADGTNASGSAVKTDAGATGAVSVNPAPKAPDGACGLVLALKPYIPPATTTLSTGTNPGNLTIAPGGSITSVNGFTLTTSADTDAITNITVNLSTNSGVGTLTITNGADSVLGSIGGGTGAGIVTGSNPITISSTDATTGGTAFKVKVTPLLHAAMPAPAGEEYAITGVVTDWTGSNTKAGQASDTSDTVTIDNLSPNGATSTSGSAGNAQVTLNWTTSSSLDFSQSVILRWAGSTPGAEVPTEGSSYAVDNTITTATVACVRSDAASTGVDGIDGAGTGGCSAVALTNTQAYFYKAFQKDSNGNYDAGVTFTDSPFTPGANSPPSISISQPDGVSDTVVVGTSYNITYILSDSDDTVTAAFYYDDDNTGLNGVAITGHCATAAEGSGVTCAWNTSGMTPGSYYVYGITDDGTNPAENAYSTGTITINAQTLTFSISENAVDFGTLNATAARFATTNASSGGSATESIAHTLAASTNVSGGYTITAKGATLTHSANSSFSIDAITSTAVNVTLGGSIGTEQFGLRLTKVGTGTVTSPYDGAANFYVYNGTASSASQIASGAGDDTSTTFSVYSAANISALTEAGTYETALIYICTGTF